MLIGTEAKNKAVANEFANWMISKDGGQHIIATFEKNGLTPYKPAPESVHSLSNFAAMSMGQPLVHVRATVPVPNLPEQIYFFQDRQYVRMNATHNTLDGYRQAVSTSGYWPAMSQAGFETIDAVFQTPPGAEDALFFSGTKCASLKFTASTDKLIETFVTADRWSSLKRLGFEAVDAALPWTLAQAPGSKLAYFFRGTQCACVDLVDDTVQFDRAEIATRFKALGKAGVRTVDAACVKVDGERTLAWFFSGSRVVTVDLKEDAIVEGPLEVDQKWSCLKTAAGFY